MFGGLKSLMDLAKERRSDEFSDASNPVYSPEVEDIEGDAGPEHGFTLELKKKRRVQILRQMLEQQGYGDLAKMVKIKEF